MTPQEARKLNPGDMVLVSVELTRKSIDSDELWCGRTASSTLIVRPEDISEKITPRRIFRKGDIVLNYRNDVRIVVQDNGIGGCVIVSENVNGLDGTSYDDGYQLQLVCAAEDRADGKEEV